jgi:anaerobic magnesium-protoporphyrin IX monomethyl ester cyclase
MIVLYNPWSTPSPRKPLPMSLLAVASTMEGEFDYEIVDGNLHADAVERILELGRRRPLTAVGITVMPGPQLNRAVPDTRRIRAALPGVPIVWGGYFPSQHAETVLRDGSVDVCVHSQGEATFLELVRILARGGSLGDVAGISWRENGAVRSTPRRPLLPLDDLPDWPYHRVPMERYLHRHYLGERVTAHHSSFGCPFACNFCAVVQMARRRWMAESPERMARILGHQRERYGADAVQFHDMDFFISEERTAEFAERISGWGMTWWALGRVDELMRYSDATWRKMKESGLKMVFCGAESGDEEALRRMNKGGKVSPNLTLELARRMREYGIVPEYSFVLGSPPDPEADVDSTIRFIRRVKEVNPATEIIMYVYTPVPQEGTLFEEARSLGFTFPETLDGWVSGNWRDFALRRDPKTPWLRGDVRRRVRDFESVLNAYHPTVTDPRLTGARRRLLRAMGSWRYRTGVYRAPLELRALQRILHYQRPETTGF